MTSDRRYQIFVSSTYRDLRAERDKILRTLSEFNYIPAGMEYFPAIDEEQFKFIKRIIDESDYYVVIVSGLYGSLAPDGLSYTEKEYEYALQKGMPICALIREDHQMLPEKLREGDLKRIGQLENFRSRLSDGRMVAFWKDENELCLKLVQSLAQTSKTYPAQGWVRGGDEEPIELMRKIQQLESENKSLTEKLLAAQEKRSTITPELKSFLESKITIPYSYVSTHGDRRDATREVSWSEIANAVLPKFYAPVASSFLKTVLEAFIRDISARSSVVVRSDIVDTTKITLAAFDLIKNYPAQKVDGGVIEFIQVTNLGTRVITLLKLEKAGLSLPAQ